MANRFQMPAMPAHIRRSDEWVAACRRQAMRGFETSGVTHDGSVADNSSAIVPEPEELFLAGAEVCRTVLFDGKPADRVIVGTAPTAEAAKLWLACYERSNRPQRAAMIEVDDPMHVPAGYVATVLAKKAAANAPAVAMTPTNAKGVAVAAAGASVKRMTWHGVSGFSLARWCGANGITGPEAVVAFAALGIPMGKSAIIGGVYAGKAGKRGAPAKLTADQVAAVWKVVGRKATVDKVSSAAAPAPAPAAPPTPAVTKADKRRANDERLAKAMAARKAAGAKGHRKGAKRKK